MPSPLDTLAPRGPIQTKASGDQWDVFLSYRSLNRRWVLRLYDQLRHLGHEVFMDQFVLQAGGSLTGQLEAHLERSATAVLIWSEDNQDSSWCEDEYRALRNLAKHKPNFRFVVASLDRSEMPLFLRDTLSVDFSALPDGPTGTGLLRLLHGLHGQPLPDEAVRAAADYDEALQRGMARVQAAASNGDDERLRELARNDAPEWTTTTLLPCRVAEALIKLDHPGDAIPLLEGLIQRFPKSIRPQQLLGLALARSGQWQAAQRVLSELHELGERDAETVGMLARTWRDRYAESQDLLHLRRARNLYAEAFANEPGNYYPGINAAANSVLLGELEAAEQHAAAVEKLVGTTVSKGDYWATATVAEVQLIRQQYAAAAALYRAAVEDSPMARSDHRSTRDQARRLMAHLQPSPDERAAIEAAFAHLA